jgi:phage tail-like protein
MTPKVPYELAIAGLGQIHFYGFCPNWPEDRQFDLWGMLPKWNRRLDSSGDLARFISCLQEITDYLLVGIDAFTDIFDLERAPESYLDLILQDLGNPFPFELDELDKRRLASVLVDLYRLKGTALGIRIAIRFFLGIEVEDITAYNGERLILGESELGVDWVAGPSDRFSQYAFEVRVGRELSDEERERITTIVRYLLPVGAHFMRVVGPIDPPVWDHWELGISDLGLSTELH